MGPARKGSLMHDLRSLSLEDAIIRHEGEAREPARRFRQLSPEDREALYLLAHVMKKVGARRVLTRGNEAVQS